MAKEGSFQGRFIAGKRASLVHPTMHKMHKTNDTSLRNFDKKLFARIDT